VELQAVVEALPGERLGALDVLGREVRAQLDEHLAGLQLDDQGVLRLGGLGPSSRGEREQGQHETDRNTGH
jgi:hypothetical protein